MVNVEARNYARYLNTTAPIISSVSPISSASTSCLKCEIDAPGGIRLIYWEPDRPSNVSSTPGQLYTQVENGFTL